MSTITLDPPAGARWCPSYYTPSENNTSRGAAVAMFAETFLVAIDGKNAGEPIKLSEWQKWVLLQLLQTGPAGLFALREALIMLPRKNGKTFLIAIVMLYMLCFAPDHAQMFSGAKDLKQALNVFKMVEAWINYNPELREMLKITKSTKTITNRFTGASYRALAADSGSLHGSNPYFVIIDELHTMTSRKHRDFVEALTTGSGAQKESIIVYISTAGANMYGNMLGDMYQRGKKIVAGKEEMGNFGFYCWEADPADDIRDHAVWEKANPMLAEGFLDISFLQGQFDKAAATNPAFFMRFFLNIWASVAGDPFVHPMIWDAIRKPELDIPAGSHVCAGFDGSQKGDSTVIIVQDLDTGVFKIWDIWERPDDADHTFFIPRQEIEESFRKLHATYNVEYIYADKFYYENDLTAWAYDYDWDIALIHQGGMRMKSMAADFLKDISEEVIFHTDEEPLNRHVANTYADDNKAFAKEDRHTLNKIDATVAAILCNGARNDYLNIDDTPVEFHRFS